MKLPTVIGPVGVEVGVAEAVAEAPADVVDVGAVVFSWYMFNRLGPPQYSEELPVHNIEHPLVAGSVLVCATEPAANVFPQ